MQQVHRLWTLMCAYICSDTSVKQKDLFLFQIIFPSIYVPQKTNEGWPQLAKVIVIIWKPSSVFLVNDYDLDSPLKASRYRNKHSLFFCNEEFPPDNVYKSIYPLRKMGLFFSGNAFYQAIKACPDLFNWSRVIVAHRECRKQTLKKTIRNIRHEKWEPCCDVDAELMYCDFLLTLRDVFFDIFVNFLG